MARPWWVKLPVALLWCTAIGEAAHAIYAFVQLQRSGGDFPPDACAMVDPGTPGSISLDLFGPSGVKHACDVGHLIAITAFYGAFIAVGLFVCYLALFPWWRRTIPPDPDAPAGVVTQIGNMKR